jgi:hypothetical protein
MDGQGPRGVNSDALLVAIRLRNTCTVEVQCRSVNQNISLNSIVLIERWFSVDGDRLLDCCYRYGLRMPHRN